jgi:oxygen-independent coproporphyrinogen-3 oxidase
VCEKHGLPAYEISNHARPGAESRHNLLYWRYGEYAGIGPGAHGRIDAAAGRLALSAERDPARWAAQVAREGHGLVRRETLTKLEEAEEILLMSLRLGEGLPLDRVTRRTGYEIPADAIRFLCDAGLLAADENRDRIAATPQGRLVLNSLIEDLAWHLTLKTGRVEESHIVR